MTTHRIIRCAKYNKGEPKMSTVEHYRKLGERSGNDDRKGNRPFGASLVSTDYAEAAKHAYEMGYYDGWYNNPKPEENKNAY